MSANLLGQEDSPYLRQHKDNPVHWRPWNDDALAEARAANKPILLSVGYSACHWCHVMAHESFEDDAIAGLMNDLFIPIKVDREERPDLDAIYQSALALMGQQGGWPLTMFLTPKGEPFWGGTYFPATPKYGRAAFPDVLRSIAKIYEGEPEKIKQNVDAIGQAIADMGKTRPADGLTPEIVEEACRAAVNLVDPALGGAAGAPKFPMPSFFRMLWRAWKRTGEDGYRQAVLVTLERMSQGGIYDHLGGGYARYSTDAHWLVPHFEKMLYDNAQLIELLTECWQETRNPLFALRVEETIGWMQRELTAKADDGLTAFVSAFDADSEGEEGKFYVWTFDEVEDLLGGDAELFSAVYDVTPEGNWEGHSILNRSRAPQPGTDAQEASLKLARQRLLEARAERVPPGRDDKVLADWNGLAIAAIAQAGAAFGRQDWIETAATAFRFVVSHMSRAKNAVRRLGHSWCNGNLRHAAVLDDYAEMARAALMLFEVTGSADYLRHAETWVAVADAHHWDENAGGYFFSADDTADVVARTKSIQDNATPSGNGVMVEVLARLYHLTGKGAYRARAEELVKTFAGIPPAHMAHAPSLLMGNELLERAVQVVIVGTPGDDTMRALVTAAYQAPVVNKVVLQSLPRLSLPPTHPAHGKGQQDGKVTAYVCRGQTCGLPALTPEALTEQLVA
jgi:uncharacterized protein YyaL (SSP411 family)